MRGRDKNYLPAAHASSFHGSYYLTQAPSVPVSPYLPVGTGKRIIAILGQSNEVGQGTASAITSVTGYTTPYDNVMLKQRHAGTNLDPPTWIDTGTATLRPRAGSPNFGVELSLGRYLDLVEEGEIAIVKFGINGSGLENNWKPTANYPSAGDNLYTQAVQFLQDAETELVGHIAAIVWIQGEADAGTEAWADAYATNMDALADGLQSAFPFAVFTFNQLHVDDSPAFTTTVRAQQATFVAGRAHTSMVNCDDLTLVDGLHFNADSYVALGNKFGTAISGLLGLDVPPVAEFTFVADQVTHDVDFTDASTDDDDSIVTWAWDFGDGSTSSLQNPTHNYVATGVYTAQLTVTDAAGRSTSKSHVVPIVAWSVDATSGKAIPQTAGEWTDFMTYANDLLVAAGESTLPNPDFALKCQDTGANPVDFLGSKTFSTSGTGLNYQIASSGWTTKGLSTFDNGTGCHRCTDAAIPDMNSGAVSLFSWARFEGGGALARSLMALGTTTVDYIGGQTVTRTTSGANGAAGASDRRSTVRPWALVGDRTNGRVVGYDDTNKVAPTSSGLVTGKAISIGAAPGVISSCTSVHHYAFGWFQALTDKQVKIVMEAAGWTISWT